MGEDFGAWHRPPNFNWKSPNLNSPGAQLDLGLSVYMKLASMNGDSPSFGLPKAPNLQIGLASEPRGWVYCLPRFRQAFTPAPPADLREQLPAVLNKSCRETVNSNSNAECAQKKFLVVDQSGDQTTLIFSSGVGDPVHCLASWKRNPNAFSVEDDTRTERVLKNLSEPVLNHESNENDDNGMESEMHEDTEELDALLYSDDDEGDSTYDDEEVTSTGHSPSAMTSFDQQEWCGEGTNDVATSSAGSTKKRKLCDRSYDDKPHLVDTANSAKPLGAFEFDDDAESSCCADGKCLGSRDLDFSSNNHRNIKKEKIRETVSILQTIIPDSEGKDAIVVLDEAIQYLKCLKLKAKALSSDLL